MNELWGLRLPGQRATIQAQRSWGGGWVSFAVVVQPKAFTEMACIRGCWNNRHLVFGFGCARLLPTTQ